MERFESYFEKRAGKEVYTWPPRPTPSPPPTPPTSSPASE